MVPCFCYSRDIIAPTGYAWPRQLFIADGNTDGVECLCAEWMDSLVPEKSIAEVDEQV